MRKVFCSYHFLVTGTVQNGFGNYLAEYDEEQYGNDIAKFIVDVERNISGILSEQLKREVVVKVLFFK